MQTCSVESFLPCAYRERSRDWFRFKRNRQLFRFRLIAISIDSRHLILVNTIILNVVKIFQGIDRCGCYLLTIPIDIVTLYSNSTKRCLPCQGSRRHSFNLPCREFNRRKICLLLVEHDNHRPIGIFLIIVYES